MSSNTLDQIIRKIKTVEHIQVVNTAKNRQTRFALGITIEDQIDVVRSVEHIDYDSGPEEDRDRPKTGEIWKFKKQAYGVTFYIKVKIEIIEQNEIKALSCHIDNIIV